MNIRLIWLYGCLLIGIVTGGGIGYDKGGILLSLFFAFIGAFIGMLAAWLIMQILYGGEVRERERQEQEEIHKKEEIARIEKLIPKILNLMEKCQELNNEEQFYVAHKTLDNSYDKLNALKGTNYKPKFEFIKEKFEEKTYQKQQNNRNTYESEKSEKQRYYEILESKPSDDFDTIKRNYRRLAKEYHPDSLGSNASESIKQFAKEKAQQINGAFDAIKKERGVK